MSAMNGVRSGYHSVNPYLNASDAVAVLAFLIDVFGGAERGERETMADGSVAHAELVIGDSVVMISQASAEMPARPTVLFAYVPDVEETYRRALASGAPTTVIGRIPS